MTGAVYLLFFFLIHFQTDCSAYSAEDLAAINLACNVDADNAAAGHAAGQLVPMDCASQPNPDHANCISVCAALNPNSPLDDKYSCYNSFVMIVDEAASRKRRAAHGPKKPKEGGKKEGKGGDGHEKKGHGAPQEKKGQEGPKRGPKHEKRGRRAQLRKHPGPGTSPLNCRRNVCGKFQTKEKALITTDKWCCCKKAMSEAMSSARIEEKLNTLSGIPLEACLTICTNIPGCVSVSYAATTKACHMHGLYAADGTVVADTEYNIYSR